jgi:hypothetical protein
LSSDYANSSIRSPVSLDHEKSSKISNDKLSRPFSLYFSDRSSTSKCTSQGGFLPSDDDDDYGFYDENDQQGMNISNLDDSDISSISPCGAPLPSTKPLICPTETPIKETLMKKYENSNSSA